MTIRQLIRLLEDIERKNGDIAVEDQTGTWLDPGSLTVNNDGMGTDFLTIDTTE